MSEPAAPEDPGQPAKGDTTAETKLAELRAVGKKILENPIEGVQQGVQQVVGVLQTKRGVAVGWALAFLACVLTYFLDLGAGSVWNGDDAKVALAVSELAKGTLTLNDALVRVPPPQGVPLGLWMLSAMVRLFPPTEAVLRFLPALCALGSALCLLAIAIDVGVGRHAGGLSGLVLLGMPLTYELSHRVLPDMLIAFAATCAVALTSHCLHGHKFDRHILPHHKDEEAPPPLPLRRWPMVFCALGIGAASLVDPRAGMTALCFGLLDVLIAHRELLRKRRVWAALGAGAALTVIFAGAHPGGLSAWMVLPEAGAMEKNVLSIWRQGDSWYSGRVGQVAIVAAGFGLLLGSLRRASRPLLAWMVVAVGMTWLGDRSPPPRGMGLVLPPLALCAAVGLESPVRWLGRFGMIITTCAMAGILVVFSQAWPVLHRDDAVKILALSQRRTPQGTLRCTIGVEPSAPSLYVGEKVERFYSLQQFYESLGPDTLFSCIMPENLVEPLRRKFEGASGQDGDNPIPSSVLLTKLDVESPPQDVDQTARQNGADKSQTNLVLVSR